MFVFDLPGLGLAHGVGVLEKAQQIVHADSKPGDGLRHSAVAGNPIVIEFLPVALEAAAQKGAQILFAFLLPQKDASQPFQVGTHAAGQHTLGGLGLEFTEPRQVHALLIHFQNEGSGCAALSHVRRKLRSDHRVSLGRSRLPETCIRAKPCPSRPVAVGTQDTLRRIGQLGFLQTASGMEVVDAGQHILQCKAVVDDAVGGVLEGQGQLCGCEASEEGQRQSCQGAFAGAGLADQG